MTSTVTKIFETLTIGQDVLEFDPSGQHAWIKGTFVNTPPNLVRIFTPKSEGSNDNFWVKSRDAKLQKSNWEVDIFQRNNNVIAKMLNTHFRWCGKNGDCINVSSWTNSWLFALQYIFYLNKSTNDASGFDDIKVCIIDTRRFPEGSFIRDLDLIQAYEQFEPGLRDLGRLRHRQHRHFRGSYYFGEYLSQGALKIEGKCKIVPASALLRSLFKIQPIFKECLSWQMEERPPWANQTICLREPFYQTGQEKTQMTYVEIEAAIEASQLFGPQFRLSVAAGLLGLLPRNSSDKRMLRALGLTFSGEERKDCACFESMTVNNLLPEVIQTRDIMKSIYDDFCFARMQTLIRNVVKVETDLNFLHTLVLDDDVRYADTLSASPGYGAVSQSLNKIETIVSALRKDITDSTFMK